MQLAVKPLHLLLFVAVTAVWGANFAVSKIGLLQIPPIMLVAMRFALVTAILLPFAGVPPRGKLAGIALLSVVLGLFHFSMMFTGLKDIDAATAAISIQLQVPFAALLAAVAFGERLGWRRALGMAIAFAGVAVIAGEPRLDGRYLSLALVIGAALVWAVANILVKHLGDVGGTQINAWMALFATPQLALASLALEQGQWAALQAADWTILAVLAYQAVLVVALGYGTWYALLKLYDVNVTLPFTLLVPFFGVFSGVVFLGEVLTMTFLVGGAMTIVGVSIIAIRRPRLATPETEGY